MDNDKKLNQIFKYIKEITDSTEKRFIPGKTVITTGLSAIDCKEINGVIKSLLNGWLGIDKAAIEFEKRFSEYIQAEYSLFVNSGSSANLVLLDGIKKLHKLNGGEIITPALTFPTTVNPVIQLGFTPVFTDIDDTLNISIDAVEKAVNKNTIGIIVPHIMGNPAALYMLKSIADKNKLFLIEDCCQALGSKYKNKFCGTYGTGATYSFYPSHKITTGEGGMIVTNNKKLYKIIKSLRDWGRTDQSENLNKRFNAKLGNISYDEKYIYSEIGYNFKPLELQAVLGLEQMKKINAFNSKRKENYNLYTERFAGFNEYFRYPETYPETDPSFFGFPLILKDKKIYRRELLIFLNEHKIDTRLLFAGNLTKQPAYKDVNLKISGNLTKTDNISANGFWLGIHPGITAEMIGYTADIINKYLFKQAER